MRRSSPSTSPPDVICGIKVVGIRKILHVETVFVIGKTENTENNGNGTPMTATTASFLWTFCVQSPGAYSVFFVLGVIQYQQLTGTTVMLKEQLASQAI